MSEKVKKIETQRKLWFSYKKTCNETRFFIPTWSPKWLLLKLKYNIDQELIIIIRLTTMGNVQLAVKITYNNNKEFI